MNKRHKSVKQAMKYEKTPITPTKKLIKKRFKRLHKWILKQAGRSNFKRTGELCFGIFTLVAIWVFFFYLWYDENEVKALFTGLIVVLLSIPWAFRKSI
jgi:hypothetical protein